MVIATKFSNRVLYYGWWEESDCGKEENGMPIHVKKWTLIGIISVLFGIGVVATPNVLAGTDSGTHDQLQTTPLVQNPLLGPGYYDDQAENSIPQNQLMAPALFSNNDQFLMDIKPGALASWQKGVLPSVTAAQAIVESGWGTSQLAIQANNLFGIKGVYNGQSIWMNTREVINGQSVVQYAQFRKYPNRSDSIVDHADFLNQNSRYRNLLGVRDYRTFASLLQQDGYATDPNYTNALISVIQSNNLQEWDTEAFSGVVKNVSYAMQINQTNRHDGLYSSIPATGIGSQFVGAGYAASFHQQVVAVSKEVVLNGVTWVNFTMGGKSCWMDKNGLRAGNFGIVKDVNYAMQINQSSRHDGLYSQVPAAGIGTQFVGSGYAASFDHQVVAISKETVINNTTWVYITIGDKSYWMDKNGLIAGQFGIVKNVNYAMQINQSNRHDGLYRSVPAAGSGSQFVGADEYAQTFDQQVVAITKEAVIGDTTWVYFTINGKAYWMDQKGLVGGFGIVKNVNYAMKIDQTSRHDGLYTSVPAPGIGSQFVGAAAAQTLDQQVIAVTKEVVINGVTWAYFTTNADKSYWIDKKGLVGGYGIVQNVNYKMQINQANRHDGLYSSVPAPGIGSQFVGAGEYASSFDRQVVTVSKEVVIQNVTWVYINVAGKTYWMDKSGLQSI